MTQTEKPITFEILGLPSIQQDSTNARYPHLIKATLDIQVWEFDELFSRKGNYLNVEYDLDSGEIVGYLFYENQTHRLIPLEFVRGEEELVVDCIRNALKEKEGN